jgi:hypothetical protein
VEAMAREIRYLAAGDKTKEHTPQRTLARELVKVNRGSSTRQGERRNQHAVQRLKFRTGWVCLLG